MKELAKESWNYTLAENESGDLVFTVVAGSVGLYEIKIYLTQTEIDQYQKEGKAYLANLANAIRTNEQQFNSRKISD
ncbi:hypothetical protein [Spirosoma sp.]|uniref:hypothetical protein n=1 Tax=Spirosoma sp. TaxID=1899569 RepID=UPI003B3B5CD2